MFFFSLPSGDLFLFNIPCMVEWVVKGYKYVVVVFLYKNEEN